MQILNSKAYYLKNYPARNYTTKSQSRHKLPHLNKRSSNNIDDITKASAVNRARRKSQVRSNDSRMSTHSNLRASHASTNSKNYADIVQKQKQILKKVIDSKIDKQKKRVHTVGTSQDYVILEKHPLSEVNSIEVESMKPTERYFHMLNNVRIAEKLLLAQPSRDCSIRDCKKFYHRQSQYKNNISKLGFRSRRQSQLSRLKLMNRKKWLD